MNTEMFKKVGGYLMIAGGTIFTAGFGMHFVARRVEKAALKKDTDAQLAAIEIKKSLDHAELEKERKLAQIEKDREYTKRLQSMNQTEFAKFRAEATARANEEALAKADDIRREAEAKVAKMKMELTDTITKLREECADKIAKAEKKRDEAVEKYEAIDRLFTNKNDILRAKEQLEKVARAQETQKEKKEELINSINNLL